MGLSAALLNWLSQHPPLPPKYCGKLIGVPFGFHAHAYYTYYLKSSNNGSSDPLTVQVYLAVGLVRSRLG